MSPPTPRTARVTCAVVIALLSGCAVRTPDDTTPWIDMFDGTQLGAWATTQFGGQGEVYVEDDKIWLEPGSPLTGVHWTLPFPTTDYELSLRAQRVDGSDFFCGLTFPVGDAWLTLVLGGWGGSLVGISCLDGKDASDNVTMRTLSFEDQRPYRVRLRVEPGRVQAWLDDETIVDFDPRSHRLALRPEVDPSKPLGIASFATTATLEALRWRPLRK